LEGIGYMNMTTNRTADWAHANLHSAISILDDAQRQALYGTPIQNIFLSVSMWRMWLENWTRENRIVVRQPCKHGLQR
jgi:hypothetical protein